MKKTYSKPEMEVIHLTVGHPLLLPVSGTTPTTEQWAPEFNGDLDDFDEMNSLLFQ